MVAGFISEFPKDADEAWRTRLMNAMDPSPAQLEIIETARRNLLESDFYMDAQGVGLMLNEAGIPTSAREVNTLREEGYVLAVPDHGVYLYPLFQFDEGGIPRAIVREVNSAFQGGNEWDILNWWRQQRPSLSGGSFADNIDQPDIEDRVWQLLSDLGRR